MTAKKSRSMRRLDFQRHNALNADQPSFRDSILYIHIPLSYCKSCIFVFKQTYSRGDETYIKVSVLFCDVQHLGVKYKFNNKSMIYSPQFIIV